MKTSEGNVVEAAGRFAEGQRFQEATHHMRLGTGSSRM